MTTNAVDAIARRVTLRELRLLLAVARSGSILKAAQEAGLTQPAVSRSVADLEKLLGVRLFDRTNRGVEATPQGRIMLRRAAGVFGELRQALEELQFLANPQAGELRIGGSPLMCGGLLSHAIRLMERETPGVRFHVAELDAERLAGGIRDRSIDASLSRKPALADAEVLFEELFEDRLFVVVGAHHPLATRRTISLEELAGQRWVLPPALSPVNRQVQSIFEGSGKPPLQTVVTAMSVLMRYELLRTGRYVTVLHGSILRFGNAPGFVRLLPIEVPGGLSIGLMAGKNRTLPPVAETFLQILRKVALPMQSIGREQLQRTLRNGLPNALK